MLKFTFVLYYYKCYILYDSVCLLWHWLFKIIRDAKAFQNVTRQYVQLFNLKSISIAYKIQYMFHIILVFKLYKCDERVLCKKYPSWINDISQLANRTSTDFKLIRTFLLILMLRTFMSRNLEKIGSSFILTIKNFFWILIYRKWRILRSYWFTNIITSQQVQQILCKCIYCHFTVIPWSIF